eukprot:scaffold5160_cov107-Isochrysis_galbana.AAC.2
MAPSLGERGLLPPSSSARGHTGILFSRVLSLFSSCACAAYGPSPTVSRHTYIVPSPNPSTTTTQVTSMIN